MIAPYPRLVETPRATFHSADAHVKEAFVGAEGDVTAGSACEARRPQRGEAV
jgi:hypothetical protein